MATLNELRTAINQLLSLRAITNALQLNSNSRERAFECYVFALVLRAVARAGGTVELHGIQSGPNPKPLVFRGGPGHLGSRLQDFCYARCALNGREFEVHTDVIYTGTSGASHEIDVSICDRAAADATRLRAGSLPNTRGLRAAIECKFYDSKLGTSLGRTFVGLVVDCGQLVVKSFVTNGRDAGLATYFSKANRAEAFFEVSPVRGDSRDRLVRVIEQALRRWASVA
jgi:hypothetical protein